MPYSVLLILICGGLSVTFCYLFYTFFSFQLTQKQYRKRLKRKEHGKRLGQSSKLPSALVKHLDLLLASSQLQLSHKQFIFITISLSILGIVLGKLYFTNLSSLLLCSLFFSCLPYCIARSYLVSKRLEAQREFLPAIELFYQYYLITGGMQIKLALGKMIDEKELMNVMQQNFTQLYRNLTLNPNIEYSLSLFNHSTGHRFARYFTQMVLVALQEGVSIKGGLKDLIDDMRKAKKQNETERHRLLEIRIANFTPILFLVFFIGVNMVANTEQAIQAYVYDERGRTLILHSLVLILLSLVMGISISRKKMR